VTTIATHEIPTPNKEAIAKVVLPVALAPAAQAVLAESIYFPFTAYDGDEFPFRDVAELFEALNALAWLGAPGDPLEPGDHPLSPCEVTHLRRISARVVAWQQDIAQGLRPSLETASEGADAGDPSDYLRARVHHAEQLVSHAAALLGVLS